MLPWLDNLLNRITMYRLMLYFLILLNVSAVTLSALGALPYPALDLLLTPLYLVFICWLANRAFANLARTAPNPDSPVITALILALIVGPFTTFNNLTFLTILGIVAMASKYVLVFRQTHIFNPAAVAVLLTAVFINQGASWWVGSTALLVPVLVGGVLVARKTNRGHLIVSFLLSYLVLFSLGQLADGTNFDQLTGQLTGLFASSPLLFFSFVMLVEPLTSPADRRLRTYFGVLVAALLFIYQNFLPQVPYSLELALIFGNVFAFATQINQRFVLKLVEKREEASSITSFLFESSFPILFRAGQFLEWTLGHPHPDQRGIRRYFTIASSPTEPHIQLTTKFTVDHPSTFKQALQKLKPGDTIRAARAEGEFVLPDDTDQPLVFVAGGIGVTPFRSMIQFLLDQKQTRRIVLFYSARTADEIAFHDLFDQAEKEIGLKTVYTITDTPPPGWADRTCLRRQAGFINEKMIQEEVPDHLQNWLYYVSGPKPMVQAFEKMLAGMGIPSDRVKHDYFPGYEE